MLHITWQEYLKALQQGQVSLVQQCLGLGLDLRVTIDGTSNTLDLAARYGQDKLVRMILNSENFNSLLDAEQDTVIFSAIDEAFSTDQSLVLKHLLGKLARNDSTMISVNYKGGSVDVVKILLEAGCVGDDNKTPYDLANCVKHGQRDLLTFLMELQNLTCESVAETTHFTILQVACVAGDSKLVKSYMETAPDWDDLNVDKAFLLTAKSGNFDLLDYLLCEMRKTRPKHYLAATLDGVLRKCIKQNYVSVVNWFLEKSKTEPTFYIDWSKVDETSVTDWREHSICEMLKLIFMYKYNNQYNKKKMEPDYNLLFGRACIDNDSKTAQFLLDNYGGYINWQQTEEVVVGQIHNDIVSILVRNGLNFYKEYGRRYLRSLFVGVVDTLKPDTNTKRFIPSIVDTETNTKMRILALAPLELILRHMKKTGYDKINPFKIFLAKATYNDMRKFDQRWSWGMAHMTAMISLMAKFTKMPVTLPTAFSDMKILYPLQMAKIMSVLRCYDVKSVLSTAKLQQIFGWSRKTLGSTALPNERDVFLRDLLITLAGCDPPEFHCDGLLNYLATDDERQKYFCDLIRQCGLVIVDLQANTTPPTNLAQELCELTEPNNPRRLSLESLARVATLRCLRKNSGRPLNNALISLDPYVTRHCIGFLQYRSFLSVKLRDPDVKKYGGYNLIGDILGQQLMNVQAAMMLGLAGVNPMDSSSESDMDDW